MFRKPAASSDAAQESLLKFEYFPLKREASFLNVLDENNKKVGTYRPEKLLGKGTFGIVSKFKFIPTDEAKEYDLPEYVAIKKPMVNDVQIIEDIFSLRKYYSRGHGTNWLYRQPLEILLERETNPAMIFFIAEHSYTRAERWAAYLRGDITDYYASHAIEIPYDSKLYKKLERQHVDYVSDSDDDASEAMPGTDSILDVLVSHYPEFKDIKKHNVCARGDSINKSLAYHVSSDCKVPTVLFLWDEGLDTWKVVRSQNLGRTVERNSALEQELKKDRSELDPSKVQKLFLNSQLFSDEELSRQLRKINMKLSQASFAVTYKNYFKEFQAWPHIAQLPGLFFSIREVKDNNLTEKYETTAIDQLSEQVNDSVSTEVKTCRLVLPWIKGDTLDDFFSKHKNHKNKAELFLRVLLLVAEEIKRIRAAGYAHRDIAGRNILVSMQDSNESSVEVHLIDAGLARKREFNLDNYRFIAKVAKKFWVDFLGCKLENEKNAAIKASFLEVCLNEKAIPPTMDVIINALQSKLLEYTEIKSDRLGLVPIVHAVDHPCSVSLSSSPISEQKESLPKEDVIADKKALVGGEALQRFGIHAKPPVVPVPVTKKVKKKQSRCVIS